jgi:two-component system sensor histidine kinase HydH
MTIRRTLLLAFLLFSVLFASLVTVVAYSRSRAALSNEIQLNLDLQARALAREIGTGLFERVQDVQGWRELEVLQDIKVGDVDKRVSRFLHDVESSYHGVYAGIRCVADGRVVAASDPTLLGTVVPDVEPWLGFAQLGNPIELLRPDPRAHNPVLTLRVSIPDTYGPSRLGTLEAQVSWDRVTRALEQVARGGREAVLLDRAGLPLASSKRILQNHADGAFAFLLGADARADDAVEMDGAPLGLGMLLVGRADVALTDTPSGLGWSVAILTPEQLAFAPVRGLLLSLLAALLLLAAVATTLALVLSSRTARPLLELAAYTRAIGHDLDTPVRNVSGSSEVRELCTAFNRMIEDLKRSRAGLVRASKLAAVGEMAAKLAHEVRTPLGIIRSSAQLVDRQPGLDEAAHEMLSFMINECDRMNQLVTSLLEGARPREPVLRPVDLHGIVHDVCDMLREKIARKGLSLELALDARPPLVLGDRDHLVQVLLNVLMNGIVATPHAGQLHIGTRLEGPEVRLDIEDSGPGIPSDRRDSVFDPFVSYRVGGIGLGLSIVREAVSAHHGRIVVGDSALGGARISIWLPQAAGGKR